MKLQKLSHNPKRANILTGSAAVLADPAVGLFTVLKRGCKDDTLIVTSVSYFFKFQQSECLFLKKKVKGPSMNRFGRTSRYLYRRYVVATTLPDTVQL